MSLRSPSGQRADLRDDAQLLVEQAGDQEEQLDALFAIAERDLRHANLLSTELHRSTAAAASVGRLSVGAHLQHLAARQLLAHVADDGSPGIPCPNAVLVVDDYGDIREVLARVLEDAGFVVRTAANGLEALIAAYEMRPGVIVMDVTMPVLDGIEATRLIKASAATRDARVIAYTGNSSIADGPTRTLFAAILHKPATPESVLATVQNVAAL
jgi:two-component system, cell cycle response regulator DivK